MYRNSKKMILVSLILVLFLGCTDKVETKVSVAKSELEYLEELITQKITVADILKAKHENKYIGESLLSWTIQGVALISVNLNEMELHHNKETKLLIIKLPEPKISNFKIDQMKTNTFKVKQAILDDDEIISFIQNEAMKKAEEALMHKINTLDYKKDSKEEAIKTLSNFFTKQQGFSNIKFDWKAES